MHAVVISEPGGPEVLQWTEVPDPRPGPGEVLVEVAAAGVNRADLMQRQGFYPPPPEAGVPGDIPGMELAGEVVSSAAPLPRFEPGARVMAIVAGAAQAEYAVVDERQLMPVPEALDWPSAGGLPEVACTVWSNLVLIAELSAGEVLLVHGGASGIGLTRTEHDDASRHDPEGLL